MKRIRGIELEAGSREERLPGYDSGFPYIASWVELDCYPEGVCPWHWHQAVELFYVESGALEYSTPHGRTVCPRGSGGFVNAGALHATRVLPAGEACVQLVHLFDPSLIAGAQGSRIEGQYVLPLTAAAQVEFLPLAPGDPAQAALLEQVRAAFALDAGAPGYELRLRGLLSEIWLGLLELARPALEHPAQPSRASAQVKVLLAYIHEHCAEKITVAQLAAAAYLSERECFRLFRDYLHTTPSAYLRACRLQRACQLLTGTDASLTEIGHACGLGSSSYFGRQFRQAMGCTPSAYRRIWRDRDKNGQK